MSKNIFILLAPKFKEFGCDVGLHLIKKNSGGKIFGLYTGDKQDINDLKVYLGNSCGNIWHLFSEEERMMNSEIKPDYIKKVEENLDVGAFGRVITADRRIGAGFVRGAIPRPDRTGEISKMNACTVPVNYFGNLYEFLNRIIEENNIKTVFCYAVAGAPATMLAEICKMKEIKFTTLKSTRIGKRYFIDDSHKSEFSILKIKEKYDNRIYLEAGKIYNSLVNSKAAYYCYTNEKKRKFQFLKNSRKLIGSIIKIVINNRINKKDKIKRLLNNNSVIIKRRILLRSQVFKKSVNSTTPFIYFPLHVEPEASTMVQAPFFTDQIYVIEQLSKSSPANMRIIVKEHQSMLGKRKNEFYKIISKMPRVELIDPLYSSIDLIKNASLTITITGTVAWEAILHKKPAIVLGDSPFLAIGEGLIKANCVTDWPEIINSSLNLNPASETSIKNFIAGVVEMSFEMNNSLIWDKYEDHKESERIEAVNNICNGIMAIN